MTGAFHEVFRTYILEKLPYSLSQLQFASQKVRISYREVSNSIEYSNHYFFLIYRCVNLEGAL